MTNYYKDYGNVYYIRFKKRDTLKCELLLWLDNFKGSVSFLEGRDFDHLVLYNTFNKPAYDCYYDLGGLNIRKLETISAGILMNMIEDVALERELI